MCRFPKVNFFLRSFPTKILYLIIFFLSPRRDTNKYLKYKYNHHNNISWRGKILKFFLIAIREILRRDNEYYSLGKWRHICQDVGVYLPNYTRSHVPPNSNLLLFIVQFLLYWVTSSLSVSLTTASLTRLLWNSGLLSVSKDVPPCIVRTDVSQQYAAVLFRLHRMQRNVFYWSRIAQSNNCTYAHLGINKRQTPMACRS